MSQRTDLGNFVILLLVAGAAGAFLGNWAGRAVLYLGMVGMVLGLVLHVAKSWGRLDVRPASPRSEPAPTPRVRRLSNEGVPELLNAVQARDSATVERLVLKHNISPFQLGPWQGDSLSARALADRLGYVEAADFFQDWSTRGNLARIGSALQPTAEVQ
ncbi:hypothetical protein ACOPJQ_08735 [Luteimonas dalianensis]|uniref:hypothetical protein n=1 Tax=Luteimonas dalianensis TaxID=1148196 RepID=UPI003BF3454E